MRNLLLPFFILTGWASFAVAQQSPDYFKVHAGELPVKAFYGLKAQPMSLQAVDPKKGIIYCKQGGGCLLYTSPSPRDQRGSRMPSSA